MYKTAILVISLFVLLTFTGCDVLADCLINGRAALYDKDFPTATSGNYYSEKVGAEVKDEPLDNDYYYMFDVTGEVPPGILYSVDYREIHFYGIPQEPGTYNFTIHLDVDHKDSYRNDCFDKDKTSKTYSIIVN